MITIILDSLFVLGCWALHSQRNSIGRLLFLFLELRTSFRHRNIGRSFVLFTQTHIVWELLICHTTRNRPICSPAVAFHFKRSYNRVLIYAHFGKTVPILTHFSDAGIPFSQYIIVSAQLNSLFILRWFWKSSLPFYLIVHWSNSWIQMILPRVKLVRRPRWVHLSTSWR